MTMKDVAAAVGVSVASVSNAYNRPEKLSEDVRARILATGAELGYHGPSAAGRALRHGRADAVGIIYADQLSYAFRDPYAITLFGAVADVLEENGISINLLPIPNDSPADPAGVTYAVVDGFLAICAGDTHPGVIAARRRGIPVVLTVASEEGGDFVTIDELAAGRALGAHLAELGHRDVVVVVDLEDVDPDGEWVGTTGVADLVHTYRQIGWADSAERLRGLAEGLGDAQVSFVSAGTNSVACAVASTRLVAARAALRDRGRRGQRPDGPGRRRRAHPGRPRRPGRRLGCRLRRHRGRPGGRADHDRAADRRQGPPRRPAPPRHRGARAPGVPALRADRGPDDGTRAPILSRMP